MAQVCGDSSYDYLWDRVHQVALRLTQKAADCWAAQGPNTLSPDSVIAVLFRVYLADWPEYGGIRGETRELEAWLQLVVSAGAEIRAARPNVSAEVVSKVLRAVEEVLSAGMREWVLGDTECPTTAQTVNAIEHILFTYKLTRRPGSSKMPTGLKPHEPPRPTG